MNLTKMEKKIYEKPSSVVIGLVPLDGLLQVSINKGEGTPPGTAEGRMFQMDDFDLDDEDNDVDSWGADWHV